MRKIGYIISLWLLMLLCHPAAQESLPLETLLEGFESEDIGQTDFLQVLQDLAENPININRAGIGELVQIPFLNQTLARAIVRHRHTKGKFASLNELRHVPGLSDELLEAILPYIRLKNEKQRPLIQYRVRLSRRLNQIRGFEEGQYQNPNHLYQRFRWQPGINTRVGFITEKDAGETDWTDFNSFYIQHQWNKARSSFVIGDFILETGQRLVFSSAYGTPLTIGSELPFIRTAFRWRPKNEVEENTFLRGGLWDLRLRNSLSLLLAYSQNRVDVNWDEERGVVSSFVTTGYHRTVKEQERADRLRETIFALQMLRQSSNTVVGIQLARTDYSHPVVFNGTSAGESFWYVSAFHSFRNGLWRWQGESAFLSGKIPAIQQSFFFKPPSSALSYGALFYYYHPDYWSRHGRAFGSVSKTPGNETGFFLNLNARLASTTRLSAYFHVARPVRELSQFSFVKRTRMVQLLQDVGQSQLLLRYSYRVRKRVSGISILPEQRFHVGRLQLRTALSSRLRITQRLEISRGDSSLSRSRQYGISFYLDARLRLGKSVTVQSRWTQFDIPDFDFRLYEFENDLPGTFRNVLLTNRGYKWFVLLTCSVAPHWRLSAKYREMWYPDESSLGSGLDTITGNRKKEVRVQVQFTR